MEEIATTPVFSQPELSPITQSLETPVIPPAAPITPESGGGIKKIFSVILGLIFLGGLGFLMIKMVPQLSSPTVTLTYWGLWEQDQILAPVIADFEKSHPKIKITYTKQSPKQYRERLSSALARGDGPDIFRIHNTWLPMFSRDLAPVPTKVASEINFSQIFYPIMQQDFKKGNQFLAIPLEIDGLGLFVNEEIFRAAGLTYPTTWEDMMATAKKLTVKDTSGRIRTAGAALGKTANIEHWSDILGLMMLQNGVDLTNPTSNLAGDALTYFSLFAREPDNTWDETLDNSILAFAKGQVAMIFAPSWQVFEIKNINPNLSFKVLPVPQLPGTKITWASYWAEGVWQKSKHQAEAFEFLKYLASKEGMTKLFSEEAKVRLFGEPYSRTDLAEMLASDPYVGAFVAQAADAQSFYLASRTFDNGINDKIIKYFEDAVNSLDKGVSAGAALETVAQGINQVLSTYGLVSSPPAGGSARQ